MNDRFFYRLKPEYDGHEYPWPCERDPNRKMQLFDDDVLTKAPDGCTPPMRPGTFMKHTGLGCFNIEVPEAHLDQYEGWPTLRFENGRAYGKPEPVRKVNRG